MVLNMEQATWLYGDAEAAKERYNAFSTYFKKGDSLVRLKLNGKNFAHYSAESADLVSDEIRFVPLCNLDSQDVEYVFFDKKTGKIQEATFKGAGKTDENGNVDVCSQSKYEVLADGEFAPKKIKVTQTNAKYNPHDQKIVEGSEHDVETEMEGFLLYHNDNQGELAKDYLYRTSNADKHEYSIDTLSDSGIAEVIYDTPKHCFQIERSLITGTPKIKKVDPEGKQK